MSHEIRQHDIQQGRTVAWHGLTDVIPDLSLSHPDFFLGKWDVEEVSVAIRRGGKFVKMPGAWSTLLVDLNAGKVNGETGEEAELNPLFVSPPFDRETYTPLPNREFLRLIGDSLKGLGLSDGVESAGSVFDRRRVFASILLPGMEEQELGHRKFRNFLNFLNSFDQSTPFLANTSNICTVCNNTFTANLSAGGTLVKHTKNMPERLAKLPDVISEALTVHREFANDFLSLESVTLGKEDAESLFASFVVANGGLSTRAHNTVARLVQLFGNSSVGNRGATLADVFSALTDYYSHESSGGEDRLKQFESSEFGSGMRSKQEAIQWLVPMATKGQAGYKEEAEQGRKLLIEYRAK